MSEKPPVSKESSGEDPVPDDVWERFVRDSELDIRTSAPKEPSARARMVTDRLRKEREAAAAAGPRRRTGRRGGKDKSRPAEPEGWRTGPAWQEMNGRAARRRRMWGVLGVFVTAGVLMVALNPSRALSVVTGGDGSDDTAAAPLPAETAAPTGAPPSFDPDRPTLKEPFRGSPAVQYADGAAGIELPDATALGGFSKERVAAALAATRTLLIESNLSPATLRGERPEAALALIDPLDKEILDDVDTGLVKPDKDHDPLTLFSRFDPKKVRLVGDVVKTRGRMTVDKGPDGGVVVHADYTFVYPVVKAAPGSTEVARTIVRRVLDIEVADPSVVQSTPGKLWIARRDVDTGNSRCDIDNGFLNPEFADDTPSGPSPSGSAVDPYDRSRSLDADRSGACGTVTRT
ncbi:hypothetical protein [Streptomyces xanthochromogenes]|uniref:Uncharacterized protein n=1 Tax=Streptomyces xanthochromogenes TaxID=67384 RepID=A0ABQ3A1I9_9ACTN|nr:hypothetical protein [Streptomyces xanthochromogenes]GGY32329.1 hypothetical protein GCM10010326_27840 [Streptomyces xanthochromogenes]